MRMIAPLVILLTLACSTPVATPYPTYTPYPTPTVAPVPTPTLTVASVPTPYYPTYTPYPTPTVAPVPTPYPTVRFSPKSTATPGPTQTPQPTSTLVPTSPYQDSAVPRLTNQLYVPNQRRIVGYLVGAIGRQGQPVVSPLDGLTFDGNRFIEIVDDDSPTRGGEAVYSYTYPGSPGDNPIAATYWGRLPAHDQATLRSAYAIGYDGSKLWIARGGGYRESRYRLNSLTLSQQGNTRSVVLGDESFFPDFLAVRGMTYHDGKRVFLISDTNDFGKIKVYTLADGRPAGEVAHAGTVPTEIVGTGGSLTSAETIVSDGDYLFIFGYLTGNNETYRMFGFRGLDSIDSPVMMGANQAESSLGSSQIGGSAHDEGRIIFNQYTPTGSITGRRYIYELTRGANDTPKIHQSRGEKGTGPTAYQGADSEIRE